MRGLNSKKKIAFISSFIPRKCGIATFTADLVNSVGLAGGEGFEPLVVAMESGAELEYQKPVRLKIRKDVKYDYTTTADYINFSNVDIVCVQHEFGLLGGDGGSYISGLLERLNKPVVTTLHTVLEEPSAEYFNSLIDVCYASDKVVVMNRRGINMLGDIYGVPESKIELIPHGIPAFDFADSDYYKRKLGIGGRRTILTFGLLGRNKGIEVMLTAMPAIVRAEPSALYIVLGGTHPEVMRREGRSYELELRRLAGDLGLEKNVVFCNHFVDNERLREFLGAADIYVTPYLHKEQLTSGTLAFAVGTGKAVVSTPYWAAEELLAEGRGRLVGFGDSEHMARTILEILGNESLFSMLRKRAYGHGRSMTWPRIGEAYWQLFGEVVSSVPAPSRAQMDLEGSKMRDYGRQHVYQSAQAV